MHISKLGFCLRMHPPNQASSFPALTEFLINRAKFTYPCPGHGWEPRRVLRNLN